MDVGGAGQAQRRHDLTCEPSRRFSPTDGTPGSRSADCGAHGASQPIHLGGAGHEPSKKTTGRTPSAEGRVAWC